MAITQIDKLSKQERTQAAWSSGDYSRIAITGQLAAEILAEALDIRPGRRVLDVAAGTGNFSLAAASRWADTTAIDIVPDFLKVAESRINKQWLHANVEIANAEAIPYSNGSFDIAASTFGIMFATDQRAAAAELIRVTRPGGMIGLTNWSPDGFMGQLIGLISTYRPSVSELPLPTQWGTQAWVNSMFAKSAIKLDMLEKKITLRYRSADHWLGLYHRYYGPLCDTFSTLNHRGVVLLTQDLLNLVEKFNLSNEGTMIVPCDYLQVVMHKR